MNETSTNLSNKPRPLVRFIARHIDLIIAASVFGLIWDTIGPPMNTKYVVNCMLSTLLWVPVEAILLSSWGTTPGKWLLNTTLRSSDGKKLRFGSAANRSLHVWAWGMGVGYPYATLVAEAFAYTELRDKGTTRWDRDGSSSVTHGTIDLHRALVTLVFVCSLIAIFTQLAEIILTPLSRSEATATVVWIGILFVIGLASIISLKLEAER